MQSRSFSGLHFFYLPSPEPCVLARLTKYPGTKCRIRSTIKPCLRLLEKGDRSRCKRTKHSNASPSRHVERSAAQSKHPGACAAFNNHVTAFTPSHFFIHNFHKTKRNSELSLFTKTAQISPRNAGLTVFCLFFRSFSYFIYI